MTSFTPHDHQSCIADVVGEVERSCKRMGLRLTDQRRQVLGILLSEHRALGAYEILDVLARRGQPAQPPVAYRALDFLVTHGFAHKVERLNAFIACAHPGTAHAAAFLICRTCRRVAETPLNPLRQPLEEITRSTGFATEHMSVELLGLCPACAEGPP